MALPLLITNNRLCAEAFASCSSCLFDENWRYGQVLLTARDFIHQGYQLLGHPQYGSIKPNQTPYRSLLLTAASQDGQGPFDSMLLIEQALAAYEKFQNAYLTPLWSEEVLEDFRTIDLSLVQSVFDRPQFSALYR